MKLTPVGKISSEYKPANYKQNKNVNFTGLEGILDKTVDFWQFVDNGGRAVQFTVEDMCGTNFPRSYKGLMAGKKYTGKFNFRALIQEALREFLTGPTMTISPFALLALCKMSFGPNANTKVENIKNLSYLMEGVKEGTKEEVTKEFLTKVATDMLDKTLDSAEDTKATKEQTQKLYEALANYSKAFEGSLNVAKENKKGAKEALKGAADAFSNVFSEIVNTSKADYSNTNFQTVKYSIDGAGKTGAADIKSYAEYVASYMHSFLKNNAKDDIINTSKKAIDSFKYNSIGKRMFVLFNMIVVTGFLMSFIPKIYTKASGKINPNASGVYAEAAKRGSKETKEVMENKETKEGINA